MFTLTAQEEGGQQNKKWLLVIVLVTFAMIMILLGTMMYYLKGRVLKSIGYIKEGSANSIEKTFKTFKPRP
ncbi:hypothetical protein ABKV19_002682 [Rosa sericea]